MRARKLPILRFSNPRVMTCPFSLPSTPEVGGEGIALRCPAKRAFPVDESTTNGPAEQPAGRRPKAMATLNTLAAARLSTSFNRGALHQMGRGCQLRQESLYPTQRPGHQKQACDWKMAGQHAMIARV